MCCRRSAGNLIKQLGKQPLHWYQSQVGLFKCLLAQASYCAKFKMPRGTQVFNIYIHMRDHKNTKKVLLFEARIRIRDYKEGLRVFRKKKRLFFTSNLILLKGCFWTKSCERDKFGGKIMLNSCLVVFFLQNGKSLKGNSVILTISFDDMNQKIKTTTKVISHILFDSNFILYKLSMIMCVSLLLRPVC